MIIAIKSSLLCPPGDEYIFWFKPEAALIAVPDGNKGFPTWFEDSPELKESLLPLPLPFYMMIGRHSNRPIKGIIPERERGCVGKDEINPEIKLLGIFCGEIEHPWREVYPPEFEPFLKW